VRQGKTKARYTAPEGRNYANTLAYGPPGLNAAATITPASEPVNEFNLM